LYNLGLVSNSISKFSEVKVFLYTSSMVWGYQKFNEEKKWLCQSSKKILIKEVGWGQGGYGEAGGMDVVKDMYHEQG
jgi:hypothetical protein